MHPVIQKTFGGLSFEYYFRQLFFGMAIGLLTFIMQTQGSSSMSIGMLLFIIINTLLYPYSRFVYESMIGFLKGDNVFFVNAIFMLIAKFITMVACWIFAMLLAPFGLGYLYYYHSREDRGDGVS